MKELLLSIVIAMFTMSSCSAASSIIIDNVLAKNVIEFSSEFYCALNPAFVVLNVSDNASVLASKAKDKDGQEKVQKVQLSVEQVEKNVKLSYDAVNLKSTPEGKTLLEVIEDPANEKYILATLKNVFNDHYSFGYVLSTEYKNGGFAVDAVEPGSAFKNAGIKVGDVIVKVDGKSLTKQDEGFFNDKVLSSCFSGKEVEFGILNGATVKYIKIKPVLEPALIK